MCLPLALLAELLEHRGHLLDEGVAPPDHAITVEDEHIHVVQQVSGSAERLHGWGCRAGARSHGSREVPGARGSSRVGQRPNGGELTGNDARPAGGHESGTKPQGREEEHCRGDLHPSCLT